MMQSRAATAAIARRPARRRGRDAWHLRCAARSRSPIGSMQSPAWSSPRCRGGGMLSPAAVMASRLQNTQAWL